MSQLEQPIGIIKTFPAQFFREMSPRDFARSFLGMNDDPSSFWLCHMGSGLPKHKVLYCYIVIGNRIRYRANISHFEGPFDGEDYWKGLKRFDDGRVMYSRYWMMLTGPVTTAPDRIERRGFQGFRYTDFIF